MKKSESRSNQRKKNRRKAETPDNVLPGCRRKNEAPVARENASGDCPARASNITTTNPDTPGTLIIHEESTRVDPRLDREFAAIRLAEHVDPFVIAYLAKRGVPVADRHATAMQLKRLHDFAMSRRLPEHADFLAHCNLWTKVFIEESDDAFREARPCSGKLRPKRRHGVPRIIAPDTEEHAMPLFRSIVIARPGEQVEWYRYIDLREWVGLRCTPAEPENGITRPIPVHTLRNREFAAYAGVSRSVANRMLAIEHAAADDGKPTYLEKTSRRGRVRVNPRSLAKLLSASPATRRK